MEEGIINALKDTPVPIILVWAGLFFILLAYVNKLGGMIEVQPNQRRSAIFIGLLLLTIGIVLNLAPTFQSDPAKITSAPPPKQASTPTPSLSSPDNQVIAQLSPIQQSSTFPTPPEGLLNEYARSLSDRDFVVLGKIYPRGNEARQRDWLEGTNGKAPIDTVQVLGQPARIANSENAVTLRANMQYCREDSSGSTDIKNYAFTQKDGVWLLESMSAAENVTPIQC